MTKRWYESTAVWGGIVAMVGVALQLLGQSLSPDDQNSLVQHLARIGSAVGGVMAIVGRLKATNVVGGDMTLLPSLGSASVLGEMQSVGCNQCKPLTGIVQGPHPVGTPEAVEAIPSFIKTQAGCVSTDPLSQPGKPESQTS